LGRSKTGKCPGSVHYTIRLTALGRIETSIREDVALLKASPLIKPTTQIIGLAYDIKTGALTEITENKSEL
jgi:carbonic anhydrase